NLLQSAGKLKLGKKFVFQYDNDSKHTSQIVKSWLGSKKIERFVWPPNSPDLNLIDHLWGQIKSKLHRRWPAKTLEELKEKITEIWYSIDSSVAGPLIDSVEKRLDECIRKKEQTHSIN
ncbi:unnamed protein product, partial [Didymodactylos carnosus]